MISDKKEEQVTGSLVRYLKAAHIFLHFCTASDMLLPNKRIAEKFENMSEGIMRPKAFVPCFCQKVITALHISLPTWTSTTLRAVVSPTPNERETTASNRSFL